MGYIVVFHIEKNFIAHGDQIRDETGPSLREQGHSDPELGMRLLDDAEEDIDRSLSLAGDVQVVKADALNSVEQAEGIAPTAKKSRKSFEMGSREIELGSLREGEMLFRQAKKRALEVIEWWAKAEEAIVGGAATHLDIVSVVSYLPLPTPDRQWTT